jgi:hypothetical protein
MVQTAMQMTRRETAGYGMPLPPSVARDMKDDNRNDFLRSIDGLDEYTFPKASRSQMVEQILGRRVWVEIAGIRHVGWDIRMNFNWNMSGHVDGGEELCQSQDARWMEIVKEDPSFLRRAAEDALSPYLDSDFRILEGDEDMACHLELTGGSRGFIALRSMGGMDLGFPDAAGARRAIESLSDDEIRNLWTACRVLDVDFCRKNRVSEMSWHLNAIRAEIEAEWLEDLDPELDF